MSSNLLDNRLNSVANFVRNDHIVIDIGTDHAYLPIYLVSQGICPSAIACDIAEGPLSFAENNVIKYHLQDKISVRLCEGLDDVKDGEGEDITIAGMGGELIASIIDNAPWLKNSQYHLILQPMSTSEVLREYLMNNGFYIEKEKAVKSGEHLYTVISAFYDGARKPCSLLYSVVGELPKDKSREAKEILHNTEKRISKIAKGLKKGGKLVEADVFSSLAAEINALKGDV